MKHHYWVGGRSYIPGTQIIVKSTTYLYYLYRLSLQNIEGVKDEEMQVHFSSTFESPYLDRYTAHYQICNDMFVNKIDQT